MLLRVETVGAPDQIERTEFECHVVMISIPFIGRCFIIIFNLKHPFRVQSHRTYHYSCTRFYRSKRPNNPQHILTTFRFPDTQYSSPDLAQHNRLEYTLARHTTGYIVTATPPSTLAPGPPPVSWHEFTMKANVPTFRVQACLLNRD